MSDTPARAKGAPASLHGERGSRASRGRWKSTPGVGAARSGPEEVEIRTSDGWALRADLYEPTLDAGGSSRGVVVLAHALMARRSEFHRQDGGLARFFVERGWKVVTFDFRGHGSSKPGPGDGGSYGYDDLVRGDWPAVLSFARSRARGKLPVVALGHSLGGHTALAAQGTGALEADAIVGFGASPWIPELEPSRLRWAAKRTILRGMLSVTRRVGRFPARALRRGSDDESRPCIEDIGRFARLGAAGGAAKVGGWGSADGREDYIAALAKVRVPVLQVASDGDRLECAPACAAAMLARCGAGAREFLRIDKRDDGGAPPGHMGIVTSSRVKDAWVRVEEWMCMYAVRADRR